jgi:hypothetical protein
MGRHRLNTHEQIEPTPQEKSAGVITVTWDYRAKSDLRVLRICEDNLVLSVRAAVPNLLWYRSEL